MIIFARPRYEYGSYQDILRLIELSGYPLIYVDEIDPASDNCYILTILNGEISSGWPDAKARIILYDLEWRLDGDYPVIPGVEEIWAADRWYADKIGARYVPLGSHPDLPTEPLTSTEKVWDAAMLAYMTHRREHIAVQCQEMGVSLAPRGWGLERHNILEQTKAMLHIHQNNGIPTVAPQRWALAAAYQLPMIAENVNDQGIFGPTYGLWADYAHLPEFVKLWRDEAELKDFGLALHDLLCVRRPFRCWIEEAV